MARLPDIWRSNERSMRPFNDFWRPFFREFDEFMEALPTQGSRMLMNDFVPAVDYQEKDDKIMITMDVPGIDRKDISIELNGNQLAVTGERREERQEEQAGRRYSERRYGSFQRTIMLPDGVKADDIQANMSEGVLTLAVNRPALATSNRIQVGEGKADVETGKNASLKGASSQSSSGQTSDRGSTRGSARRQEPDSNVPLSH